MSDKNTQYNKEYYDNLKQSLHNDVKDIFENYKTKPENIIELLEYQSQFYNYSIVNNLLIKKQNPYATFVASYNAWKEKGYNVNQGAKGLSIFVPVVTETFVPPEDKSVKAVSKATKAEKEMLKQGQIETSVNTYFKVGHVFDISQTNCPTQDYPNLFHMGYSSEKHSMLYDKLKDFCQAIHLPVEEKDLTSISLRGLYTPDTNSIVINDKLSDTEKLSTLSHEIGHAIVHHVRVLPTAVREYEADCISIMLQSRFSMPITDSRKEHLVEHYRNLPQDFEIDKSLSRVCKAFTKFYDEFTKSIEVEKEHENKQEKVKNTVPVGVKNINDYEQTSAIIFNDKKAFSLIRMGVPVGSYEAYDKAGKLIDNSAQAYTKAFRPIKSVDELINYNATSLSKFIIDPQYMNSEQSGRFLTTIDFIANSNVFDKEQQNRIQLQLIDKHNVPITYDKMMRFRDEHITHDIAEKYAAMHNVHVDKVYEQLGMRKSLTNHIDVENETNIQTETDVQTDTKPQEYQKTKKDYPKYSEEDNKELCDAIKQNVDITELARAMGYTVVRDGRLYSLSEHDSVKIYPDTNSFAQFSKVKNNGRFVGGSVIDFAMHMGGMERSQAIEMLKNQIGYIEPVKHQYDKVEMKPKQIEEPKEFVLPKQVEGKQSRAFAYLTKTRGIEPSIVSDMMKQYYVYEDERHNAVFCGKDKNGEIVYATKRSTSTENKYRRDVEGSNQEVGVFVNNNAPTLVVNEAFIDSMSYMTLMNMKGKDYKAQNYLAVGGVSGLPVIHHLKENPNIKKVVLGMDNDNAGKQAVERIKGLVDEYCQQNNCKIEVCTCLPHEKDFNQDLLSARGHQEKKFEKTVSKKPMMEMER